MEVQTEVGTKANAEDCGKEMFVMDKFLFITIERTDRIAVHNGELSTEKQSDMNQRTEYNKECNLRHKRQHIVR